MKERQPCESHSEVPSVMHTKYPATVMVSGLWGSEGQEMPRYIFSQGLRVQAFRYINGYKKVVKPGINKVCNGRIYVFKQNSAPSPKSL